MQINKFASQALTTRNASHISNTGPPEFTRPKTSWKNYVMSFMSCPPT